MTPAQAKFIDAVRAAFEKGAPLGTRDLMKFEPAAVRFAFDEGHIERREIGRGGAVQVVLLPVTRVVADAPLHEDLAAENEDWSRDDLDYLNVAYASGASFAAMSAKLGRPGGTILQKAWSLDLARGRTASDGWETIPAWRIRRFKGLLEEARRRGHCLADDGADLTHRALKRMFDLGRLEASGELARHYHPWNADDLGRLKAMREEGLTIGSIAFALARTVSAVSSKVFELHLGEDASWSEDEDRILQLAAERGLTNRQIAKFLPGRTYLAVKQRARKLLGNRGTEPWTESESDRLVRAYRDGEALAPVALELGRPIGSLRWRAKYMGLSHPTNTIVKSYTAAEDVRIREGWKRGEKPADIAADLGRPIAGIYNRAFKLGITGAKAGYRRPLRQFEVAYIKTRAEQGWKARDIAIKLRRSQAAVYKLAEKNGISFSLIRRMGDKVAAE